jgi:hypothetical protein
MWAARAGALLGRARTVELFGGFVVQTHGSLEA